jgi:Ca2+-binding EF-hand superfamily protein
MIVIQLKKFSKVLKLFEEGNTGKISLRNLKSVSKMLRDNINDDEVHVMIDKVD